MTTASFPDSRPDRSPQRPAQIKGVISDGDDTLWLTEELYDNARSKSREIVAGAGLDAGRWESAQRSRDLANVAVLGLSAERFPTSCVQAFDIVAGVAGVDLSAVRAQVWDAAAKVFDVAAPLREGVVDTLNSLAHHGTRLALLTKGDECVQQRRIEDSGVAHFFDVVRIVDAKTPAAFASTATSLGLSVDEVISVGNSVASDILPSHEAGIFAVWLPAYVWDYEQRHDPNSEAHLHRIRSFNEIVDVVAGDS